MSVDPVADWGAKVMGKGYKVTGDVRSGLHATVPYLTTWGNAFGFTNAVILPIYATHVGPMTFTHPYRFVGGDTPMYAQRFSVEPVGYDGTSIIPNLGLRAGEFWSHAICVVEFESVPWSFDGLLDDPNGLNQLDPANPITYCEQSVEFGGKMTTRKGLQYRYSDDNKPVQGDAAVASIEAKLVLNFPRVGYLPWQLLLPYINKVNSDPILSCAAETLLLEAPSTRAKASINSPVPIEQSVTLKFAYDPIGWNKMPKPDGSMVSVYRAGDSSKGIYDKVDFRGIFATLSLSEV